MFMPRSRVYAIGHPSGAYCRQLSYFANDKSAKVLMDVSLSHRSCRYGRNATNSVMSMWALTWDNMFLTLSFVSNRYPSDSKYAEISSVPACGNMDFRYDSNGDNSEKPTVLTDDSMFLTLSFVDIERNLLILSTFDNSDSEYEKNAVKLSRKPIIDVAGVDGVLSGPWWLPDATWSGMVTPSMPPSSTIKSASGDGCPQANCIVRPSAMLPARSTPLKNRGVPCRFSTLRAYLCYKLKLHPATETWRWWGRRFQGLHHTSPEENKECMLPWIHTWIFTQCTAWAYFFTCIVKLKND